MMDKIYPGEPWPGYSQEHLRHCACCGISEIWDRLAEYRGILYCPECLEGELADAWDVAKSVEGIP